MNVLAPVSTIMTTKIVTLSPDDSLANVKDVFEKNTIHHIPIVQGGNLVGLVSKHDFEKFHKGMSMHYEDRFVNQTTLHMHKVKEIMVAHLAKLEPTDRINVALDVFLLNRFHALPVVENGALVGIVTTHDIIKKIVEETTVP